VSSADQPEKSNEITAIPDLLDLLTLKGAATVSACRLR
jgi:predicted transposase YbfD/YdcC